MVIGPECDVERVVDRILADELLNEGVHHDPAPPIILLSVELPKVPEVAPEFLFDHFCQLRIVEEPSEYVHVHRAAALEFLDFYIESSKYRRCVDVNGCRLCSRDE